MRGYRKIGSGPVTSSLGGISANDNYELDEQIRTVVHSPIIEKTRETGEEEYYVVVYRKVAGK